MTLILNYAKLRKPRTT